MSRAEEITSEVRRLVLTCRAMEAQLQQSIPKKTHEEVVSKMQATIDELDSEVGRIRTELQRTTGITDTLNGLGAQIASSKETIVSQNNSLANQSVMIDSQNKMIESLVSKLSQDTVPAWLYSEAKSRANELEEKYSSSVPKAEFVELQKNFAELTESFKSTVPKSEVEALQAQLANYVPKETFDQLQNTLSQYVPNEALVASQAKVQELEQKLAAYVPVEQLAFAESKVHELEAKLSDSVPKSDFEELSAKFAALSQKPEVSTISAPALEAPVLVEEKVPETPQAETIVSIPDVPETTAAIELVERIVVESPLEKAPQPEAVTSQITEQVQLPLETIPAVKESQEMPQVSSVAIEGPPMESNIVELQTASPVETQLTAETIAPTAPETMAAPFEVEESSPVVEGPVTMPEIASAEVQPTLETTVSVSVSAQEATFAESPSEKTSFAMAPAIEVATPEAPAEASTVREFALTPAESVSTTVSLEEVTSAPAPAEILGTVIISSEPPAEQAVIAVQSTEPQLTEVIAGVSAPAAIQEQILAPEETASAKAEAPGIEPIASQEIPAATITVQAPIIPEAQTIGSQVEEVHSELASAVEIAAAPVEALTQSPIVETVTVEGPAIDVVTEAPTTSGHTVETAPAEAPTLEATVEKAAAVETPAIVQEAVAVQTAVVEQVAVAEPVMAVQVAAPEIREVQSQLSEIKAAVDSGSEVFLPAQKVVDYSLGFIFRNTGFCARSGLEFLQDLEQIPLDVLQNHLRGGDFEKWFADVLSDTTSAESIKAIRESSSSGEELRTKIVAVIQPKYKR